MQNTIKYQFVTKPCCNSFRIIQPSAYPDDHICIVPSEQLAKLFASSPEFYRFVESIAGCVKCSDSEQPNKTDHLAKIVDDWIETAKFLINKLNSK